MLQPDSIPRRRPFASTDAATFHRAERAGASSARRWLLRRSIPLIDTFARLNCACCTAESSSSASALAGLRFATDVTDSEGDENSRSVVEG